MALQAYLDEELEGLCDGHELGHHVIGEQGGVQLLEGHVAADDRGPSPGLAHSTAGGRLGGHTAPHRLEHRREAAKD